MNELEINELIHTKVFKFCRHVCAKPDGRKRLQICDKCRGTIYPGGEVRAGDYSTDIAAAFEVVAEMERRGYFWEMTDDVDHYTDLKKWAIQCYLPTGSKGMLLNKTFSEGICLAALNALGIEIE